MKVGDKVKIRSGLLKTYDGTNFNNCCVVLNMQNYKQDYCFIVEVEKEDVFTVGITLKHRDSSFFAKDLVLIESLGISFNYLIL